MATEVRHGSAPKFKTSLLPGRRYWVRIEGRYTRVPRLAAGGVTAFKAHASSGVKRQAELLVLRTCFLEWFIEGWINSGGAKRSGVAQVRNYPFRRQYKAQKGKRRG